MANYTKFWKVWLRFNLLTKDVDNDYTAEVSTMKNSLRNEDIAQRIINEGSEIKYDTLLSIINQHDRIIREAVMDGYSVLTKTCQFTPRVTGSWIGSSAKFDPEKHKVTLDITLASEMREALSHVGVEVLEVKGSGAQIGLVTDEATGLATGVITPGDDILIDGEKIRVAGDAAGVGVFFIGSDDVSHPVTHRLSKNDPKCVRARVPADLADGKYTLRIVTQFSNTSTLLKEPRTLEYERQLTVGNGGSDDDDDGHPVIE
ncbi:MAG: DUF4469 domain-containing protein [Parabacteroides sp.]|nr:DUF4469 domain-containing protein [Parabacteroides sp.]